MVTVRLASLFALLAAAAAALAQPPGPEPEQRLQEVQHDAKAMDQALRTGRRVAAFCANCHGESGNSVRPDVPNLAGQNSNYLLEQVKQFADGRRKNMFMEGLVKAMSADEKVGVAVFFASQEVITRPAKDDKLAARGKQHYEHICFACHGESGRGSEKYARIAGQQADYLTTTLKRYRDGSATRMNPIMAGTTKPLKDADVDALVAYISSMR
jgi:cytochrome c553